MKNNRKIEVGQVRMYPNLAECEQMYVILSVGDKSATIKVLSGEDKDQVATWPKNFLDEDIVVM
ncbi:conserved hypothetical protein [Vibrio phage 424E50-1]|nr:conserved hypothetical protein [Vibrio phage 424E50-1]